MKKNIFWLSISVLVAAALLTSPLDAQDQQQEMAVMDREAESGKEMMGGKMKGMHMMMKWMMEKSVVATSDGGLVVVAGNKITKYDQDLNVVKEAEIKMDLEAMGRSMKEMMAQCPMMKEKEPAGEEQTSGSDHDH